MNRTCFFRSFSSPIGRIYLAEADGRLVAVGIRQSESEFRDCLVRCGFRISKKPTSLLDAAQKQIEEYLAGSRMKFDIPIEVLGTPFQKRVWESLLEIPYGEKLTYGQLAARVGCPRGARAVGQAVGSNRIPIVIPCHRVIACQGKLGGFGCGLGVKQFLLDLESRGRQ
ncbi:MAG TPA: methylated-DNA--[protein]-cysteine S-methyltransferase [bacterium]|nr:methylated-DNA--[protein]-cysteine S-methyltransferase [bacterium]